MIRQSVLSNLAVATVFSLSPIALRNTLPLYRPASVQRDQQTSSGIPTTTQGRFLLVLVSARLPGGSVWVRRCDTEEALFHQDSRVLPLRDALDSIVRMDPRYRWQNANGVVNLMPAAGEPELLMV